MLMAGMAWGQEPPVKISTILSRQLAAESANLLYQGKTDLAFSLAVEAYRQEDTWEARSNLLSVLQYSPKLDKIIHPEDFIYDILCKSDSILLVLSSGDSSLVIRDALGGSVTGRPFLFDTSNGLSQACLSHDGKILAIVIARNESPRPKSLIVWERSTGKIRGKQIGEDVDSYWNPSFSPDGRILAYFSYDSLAFWNLSNGNVVAEWMGNYGYPRSNVAFSPYGNIAAVGFEDDSVLLFDAINGQQVDAFPSRAGRNDYSLAFSPDGSVLAAGRYSRYQVPCSSDIDFWEIGTGERIDSIHLEFGPRDYLPRGVHNLVYNPAGTMLASTADSVVILWRLPWGRSQVLRGQGDYIWGLKFSPDGSRLVSWSNEYMGHGDDFEWNNTTIVWDVYRDDAIGDSLPSIGGEPDIKAISPDGRRLVFQAKNRSYLVWDIDDGRSVGAPLPIEWDDYVRFALNPDGTVLAISSPDKTTIILWDVEKGAAIGAPLLSICGFRDFAFSPDGSILAAGCRDGTIDLWDVANQTITGNPLRRTEGFVSDIVFSSDGTKLASNIADSAIDIWDVSQGEAINDPLTIDSGSIRGMSFSPDGSVLAAGCVDGRIFLWDLSHGNAVRRLFTTLEADPFVWGKPYKRVTSILFSSDGSMIAVGAENNYYEFVTHDLTLWDVRRGEMIGQPLGDYGELMALRPDGKTLVATDSYGGIHTWNIDVDYWAERACEIANRNLSQKEWIRYVGPEFPFDTTCPGASIPE